MSLTNKIDFAVVFKVKNANPNGDPLNGNRPRTSYNRIGEVSDVCIKRKIRNRLMEVHDNGEYKYDISSSLMTTNLMIAKISVNELKRL